MKTKILIKLFLSPIFIFSITSCGLLNINRNSSDEASSFSSEEKDSSASSSKDSSMSSDSLVPDEIPNKEYDVDVMLNSSEGFEEFWNPHSSLYFNITMSQEAANFINDYQSNHDDSTYFDYYVPCTFSYTLNGVTTVMEEVGIRQKGNMSRTRMLEDGNLSLNRLCHYKLSFKETFDDEEYDSISILQQFKKTWDDTSLRKERKNRTLFDMEKLDIKWNRNNDETKVKQAYAYKSFRDNGILAPHDTIADTTIGIEGKTPIHTTYEAIEVIDSVFVKRHFDAARADGDLYKCTYTWDPANFSSSYKVGQQIGVEDNSKNYHPAYDLKTNKKKNTTHTNLLNFIKAINDTTSNADAYRYKMDRLMDLDGFMMLESIAFLAGNFDDMRNNANNYYLYFASQTNIAYFIPYDFDRCFGMGCEGKKDYMTDFSAESTKMQCSGSWQTINLYWRTICSSTSSDSGHKNVERIEYYRAMYQKNIEDLLNNKKISTTSFTEFVNSFPNEYRGNPSGAGNNNTTFDNYLNKKIQAIKNNNPSYNID